MSQCETLPNTPNPTIAASIDRVISDEAIENLPDDCVIELRFDKFPILDPDFLGEQVQRFGDRRTIGTVRWSDERGAFIGPESARLEVYQTVVPLVDCVDIELKAEEIRDDVISLAKANDTEVIVSNHDFFGTPDLEELTDRLVRAFAAGANYFKVATSAKTLEAYRRLIQFTCTHADLPIIVVAMDDYGPISRIALPGIGSRLSYCFVAGEVAVAKGQLSVDQTVDHLKLYP